MADDLNTELNARVQPEVRHSVMTRGGSPTKEPCDVTEAISATTP